MSGMILLKASPPQSMLSPSAIHLYLSWDFISFCFLKMIYLFFFMYMNVFPAFILSALNTYTTEAKKRASNSLELVD